MLVVHELWLLLLGSSYGVSAGKRDQINKKIFFKVINILDQMIKSTSILLRNFFLKKISIWSLFPALTPYCTSLFLPSFELLVYYQNAFIVLIKKRLDFNRHLVSSKWLSISAFPELIFVHLFESEPTFWYSLTQRKYYCQFQEKLGEERLKQILNYEY